VSRNHKKAYYFIVLCAKPFPRSPAVIRAQKGLSGCTFERQRPWIQDEAQAGLTPIRRDVQADDHRLIEGTVEAMEQGGSYSREIGFVPDEKHPFGLVVSGATREENGVGCRSRG
jgi:hypothetical protein